MHNEIIKKPPVVMLMFLINAVKEVQHSIFNLEVQFEPTGQSVAPL